MPQQNRPPWRPPPGRGMRAFPRMAHQRSSYTAADHARRPVWTPPRTWTYLNYRVTALPDDFIQRPYEVTPMPQENYKATISDFRCMLIVFIIVASFFMCFAIKNVQHLHMQSFVFLFGWLAVVWECNLKNKCIKIVCLFVLLLICIAFFMCCYRVWITGPIGGEPLPLVMSFIETISAMCLSYLLCSAKVEPDEAREVDVEQGLEAVEEPDDDIVVLATIRNVAPQP